jgi:NADPH-dependent 2,4-dienoyl-CoA reductase/sulfur reductase-like enzyme
MIETIEVVIIGAGPAGLAAAHQARALGLQVRVLDEQHSPGGQIYRGVRHAPAARQALLGTDYQGGAALVREFLASGVDYVPGASVWLITAERRVHYLVAGNARVVQAQRVIFCCGAYERPMPIPGWTLPGVMTAGAGQVLFKSSGQVPASNVVLAGSGPLLYLLAWQYLQAGIKITALVDTSSRRDLGGALRHLPAAFAGWRQLAKGIGYISAIRRAGIAWYRGATKLSVEGVTSAEALSFEVGGRTLRIASELILLHQGIVPNTQPTLALGATHRWDERQLCWIAQQNAWGELSVPGCFIAGDAAGIDGAQAAYLQGQVVAIGVALSLQRLSAKDAGHRTAPLLKALRRYRCIRPLLETLYRPQEEFRRPANATVVCRCEEVTAGDIRGYAALGCLGPNQTKAFGRCGMGPCQGRMCGLAVTELLADAHDMTPSDVGYYRIRPPLKPITLAELATEH